MLSNKLSVMMEICIVNNVAISCMWLPSICKVASMTEELNFLLEFSQRYL